MYVLSEGVCTLRKASISRQQTCLKSLCDFWRGKSIWLFACCDSNEHFSSLWPLTRLRLLHFKVHWFRRVTYNLNFLNTWTREKCGFVLLRIQQRPWKICGVIETRWSKIWKRSGQNVFFTCSRWLFGSWWKCELHQISWNFI